MQQKFRGWRIAGKVAVVAAAVSFASSSAMAQRASIYDNDPSLAKAQGSNPGVAGESPTSCIMHDDQTYGVLGTIGVFSDLNPGTGFPTPSKGGDSFQFLSLGEITKIEWYGYYRNFDGAAFSSCGVQPDDNFTIQILGDAGGFPDDGNILFEVTQAGDPANFNTGLDTGLGIGDRIFLRNEYNLPAPFQVQTLEPMWFVVFNDTVDGNCLWWYRPGPPGDASSGTDDFTGWDGADIDNDFDFAYCMTFESSGPTSFPPSVQFDLAGPVDVETGCCEFTYTVRNRNSPGVGFELNEFYVTMHKGEGPNSCESLGDITPPAGFDVEFCEPWSDGVVVYRFFGGNLPPQEETFGFIRTTVNGENPVLVMVNDPEGGDPIEQEITIHTIRAWGSQENDGGACGAGSFGPFAGQTGIWSSGDNGICDIEPIPAMNGAVKVSLAMILLIGGALLVVRSKMSVATA